MKLRRLVASAVGASAAILLVAVVWGMATGRDREFDRGTASSGIVGVQLVLGALVVLLLLSSFARLPALWRGESNAAAVLLTAAGVLWVPWAFVRVIEYSS